MENNNNAQNVVHGFKVFNPDWSCSPNGNTKQYTCPGYFEEEEELVVCENGMHFCQTAADCFNYYKFDSNNKVAEVIAYGEVLTDGKKSCTNKLEIVREIPWDEVLQLVNIGKNCTGYRNTGDRNTGSMNTGGENTGDRNTGSFNAGDWNTGYSNIGDGNTGSKNTGDKNTGDWNTGNRNTGDMNLGGCNIGSCNTGSCNTGYSNTGDYNTGNRNTGDRNTGHRNIGNCNTGDWNKSSFNTGCFNTEEQKILMFNKPSNMTYRDWLYSEARFILDQIPKDVVELVHEKDMTDGEKAAHPSCKTTRGYIKVLDESKCAQIWWNELSDRKKNIIKSIPNFDAEIFYQCTGIRVDDRSNRKWWL